MHPLKTVIAGVLLAATPFLAQADDLSYSYVDLGWVSINPDGAGGSEDGFGLRGSFGFAENFFGYAEYSSFDVAGADLDLYSVGFGGHYGISDNADLVGRIGYAKAHASISGAPDLSADGYEVAAGLRGQVGDSFELEGNVIYQDLGNEGGNDTQVGVGGRYFFTENFAVGAEYRVGDDADTIIAGVRLAF